MQCPEPGDVQGMQFTATNLRLGVVVATVVRLNPALAVVLVAPFSAAPPSSSPPPPPASPTPAPSTAFALPSPPSGTLIIPGLQVTSRAPGVRVVKRGCLSRSRYPDNRRAHQRLPRVNYRLRRRGRRGRGWGEAYSLLRRSPRRSYCRRGVVPRLLQRRRDGVGHRGRCSRCGEVRGRGWRRAPEDDGGRGHRCRGRCHSRRR